MDIILKAEDVIALINECYDGVQDVTFNSKNIKITLNVDSKRFLKKNTVKAVAIGAPVIDPKNVNTQVAKSDLSLEERNELAAKKGLMVSGGEQRTILRVG